MFQRYRIMKRTIGFLLILVLLGCNDVGRKVKNANEPKAESDQMKDSAGQNARSISEIRITGFTEIPDDLVGCGCFLYGSEEDERKGLLIFAGDGASPAAMALNGEMTQLRYVKVGVESIELITSENIKVVVKYDERIELDSEGSRVKGTIELLNGGKVVRQNFVGYCGC